MVKNITEHSHLTIILLTQAVGVTTGFLPYRQSDFRALYSDHHCQYRLQRK